MTKLPPVRFPLALVLLFGLLAGACGNKKAPIPPPPPPPDSSGNTGSGTGNGTQRAAILEFAVEPATIERGQSATIRWSVSNSTDIAIDGGIGTVQSSGNRRVIPSDTTTYRMTANGPGGSVTATTTVTVTGPAPPPAPTNNTSPGIRGTFATRVQSDLQDALFDYDNNNIRDDARQALTADSDAMKRIFADFPNAVIYVEGHCDDRGSAEYNLGLGDRRASAALEFLKELGVPADRLKTISYGKERPACTESNEACWQRNRRAHFSSGQ